VRVPPPEALDAPAHAALLAALEAHPVYSAGVRELFYVAEAAARAVRERLGAAGVEVSLHRVTGRYAPEPTTWAATFEGYTLHYATAALP
jgi:hypothetical protein